MAINPVTGVLVGASQPDQLQRTAQRIQATIASLVSGNRLEQATDAVSDLAIAAQLQNQISTLKQTAGNISQALSLTQVADQGIERETEIVDRMRALATQANNGTLDNGSRQALDNEFQSLKEELNRISSNTQFNGQKLLDGSLSLDVDRALGGEGGNPLTVDNLSAGALFDNKSLNLLSQGAAAAALQTLDSASNKLTAARADIGSYAQSLDYAAANIETAFLNQEAARSTLADTDFASAASDLSRLNLQRDIQQALAAQGNKLSPQLLQLLS